MKDFTMFLSNLGVVYMSTNDLKFKGFIPIIGVKIKKFKKDANHSIVIYHPDGKTAETMMFGSEFEQEDWFETMQRTASETHDKMIARN